MLNKIFVIIKFLFTLIMFFWCRFITLVGLHKSLHWSDLEYAIPSLFVLIAGILAVSLFIFELYHLRHANIKNQIIET